jgi:hypothetical protein
MEAPTEKENEAIDGDESAHGTNSIDLKLVEAEEEEDTIESFEQKLRDHIDDVQSKEGPKLLARLLIQKWENDVLLRTNFDVPKFKPLVNLVKSGYAQLAKWRAANVSIKAEIDLYSCTDQVWYRAIITGQPSKTEVKIKYKKFKQSKYDEIVDISPPEGEIPRILPVGALTFKKVTATSKPVNKEQERIDLAKAQQLEAQLNEEAKYEWVTSLSGRKKKVLKEEFRPRRAEKTHKKRGIMMTIGNDHKTEEMVDQNDWICAICHEFEAFDGSNLICCDGPCLRAVHMGCLGISKENLSTDEWLCEECSMGVHSCFVCGDATKDTLKCSAAKCGKFYHLNCLMTQDYDIIKKGDSDILENAMSAETEFKFKCPLHKCATCSTVFDKKSFKMKLESCVFCPRAYHGICIPPGGRFNKLCLICPRHPERPLPDIGRPKSSITSGQYSTMWNEMFFCEECPRANNKTDPNHFRLPTSIKNECNAHPPQYDLIWKLDYGPLERKGLTVQPRPITETCTCKDFCGDDCLNRILRVECYNSKDSNCEVGSKCGNRQFLNKEHIKMKPVQEPGMGWGCRAMENVRRGTLVIEYVGEVIDMHEMRDRMTRQRIETPQDRDFYIMELDEGYYIDGKRRGSLSRFINHSCDPNCELIRWSVRGMTRIGTFQLSLTFTSISCDLLVYRTCETNRLNKFYPSIQEFLRVEISLTESLSHTTTSLKPKRRMPSNVLVVRLIAAVRWLPRRRRERLTLAIFHAWSGKNLSQRASRETKEPLMTSNWPKRSAP